MSVKADRLARDLESLDATSNVTTDGFGRNTVSFESEGPRPGDLTSEVLRVLSEHDCYVAKNQPDDRYEWWAGIHLE